MNNKKIDYQLEGETRIRPMNHLAFSPNATNIAFISVRTADEEVWYVQSLTGLVTIFSINTVHIFSMNFQVAENRSVIVSKDLQIKRAQYATMWDFGKESSIWRDTDGVWHGP